MFFNVGILYIIEEIWMSSYIGSIGWWGLFLLFYCVLVVFVFYINKLDRFIDGLVGDWI